jgi:peptidoglycan/xylan/chitin deacetylase (PgdA/CDA1 family)
VLKSVSRALITGAMRQVARLPATRRIMHSLSVSARGECVVFLRCRRLLPDNSGGRSHPDLKAGTGMLASTFERTLIDVKRTLRFMHAGEAVSALQEGTRIKESMAVLTFDESFASTAELALPILQRLGIPALFFVSTSHLSGDHSLWDQEVFSLLERMAPTPLSVPWVDSILRTESRKARTQSARRLLLTLLPLDETRVFERVRDLHERAGLEPRFHPLDRMLTAHEVGALAKDPHVSIGAHGHRHVSMTGLSDEMLVEELTLPRTTLRELCRSSFIDVVSYPFGRPPYVDERVATAARAAGYRAAFTAVSGVARPGDHRFLIPRLALRPGVVDAFALQGVSDAVDELLYVATATEDRVIAELEG